MALPCRVLYRQCRLSFSKPARWTFYEKCVLNIEVLSSANYFNCNYSTFNNFQRYEGSTSAFFRQYATQLEPPETPQEKKPGLIKRFKQMAKDYWYVLLPVHGITSAIWFGGFYYAVSSGVDVLGYIESLELSERIMEPIRKSGAGYFALAFACYKVVSPLRYAVTLGATTYAIKRLTKLGWIKPMPSKERIKEVLQEKKENIQDRITESKQHYHAHMQQRKAQLNEKKVQVMEEMSRYKEEMRNMKDKVKKM